MSERRLTIGVMGTSGGAPSGLYAYIRHPQYVGFIVIMSGFLLQWPTLLTLVMFPVLAWAYVRLARREEDEVRGTCGVACARYAAVTPAFIPHLKRLVTRQTDAESSHL